MELLLLRHSTTQGNLERRYVGSQDHPLVEEGIKLAQEKRRTLPLADRLWCSPMLRCRQTAELLFPGLEQTLAPALKECDFGDFEGKTWDELKDDPIYNAWIGGDPTVCFPNGEVLGEHIARCRAGVAEIVRAGAGEGLRRIAILAHGGTLMSAMSGFAVPHRGFYQWLPRNCGGYLVGVEVESMTFTLIQEI